MLDLFQGPLRVRRVIQQLLSKHKTCLRSLLSRSRE